MATISLRQPHPERIGKMNFPVLLSALFVVLFSGATTSAFAAATLTQKMEPAEANIGDPVIISLIVQNGSLGQVQLPPTDGIAVNGTSISMSSVIDNGSYSTSYSLNFSITPTKAGDLTIPAFDVQTQDGETLHVHAMKLHVLSNDSNVLSTNPAAPSVVSPPTATTQNSAPNPQPNPNGPVVMPPNNPANPAAAANTNGADTSNDIPAPRDKDGTPAKVFLIINTSTTNAYVGQSIPLRIDFYIRMDVNAQQNSLPTIVGSDFLMNSFTTRGNITVGLLENQQYERETWISAISAPKSGDFPLTMVRDSYWVKSMNATSLDPFNMFFNRQQNLAHEDITSNQLVMHVQPLPDDKKPAHFTGAIGQFKVTGTADPGSVAVGEPVTLHFVVSGQGNFDYVRSPALGKDPNWKAYTPTSKTDYLDESHTNAVKTFDQSVIPQKNGNLPLPAASFSYFDPNTKQYVTTPIALPEITVTGSAAPTASASPGDETDATGAAAAQAKDNGFRDNRTDLGSTRLSMKPAYREIWFWAIQAFLILLVLGAIIFRIILAGRTPDSGSAERALRMRSLHQEEDAMAEAVRQGDALAFFVAARHAIQLQLGAQWHIHPESLTLSEIRQRDAALAETLEPLFVQADQVIYSGSTSNDLDLAQWETSVRTELLQLQPA
jgi:hypothetical protein